MSTRPVRPVVSASWQRSRQAGVDRERTGAPERPGRELDARWAVHPLAPYVEVIERMLDAPVRDAGHIVVVADHDGCLLWSTGHPRVLAASETIDFTPGHLWSEAAAGTNGVGTALALDAPVQIHSDEHFRRPVQRWVCAGAPVHDPRTGRVLGAIDLSCGVRAAHPSSLALVTATATMVETLMAHRAALRVERLRAAFYERMARRAHGPRGLIDADGHLLAAHPDGWLHGPLLAAGPGRWLAPGSSRLLVAEPFLDGTLLLGEGHEAAVVTPEPVPLRLAALGPDRLAIDLGTGTSIALSPRRSQLLALLALAPGGRTGAELAAALYGPGDHEVALRAEVSRLRRQLGGLIGTHPYRLVGRVIADPAVLDRLAGAATPLQR